MSTENAINFLAQVDENTSLQEKLKAIKTPDELIALAKEQGYEVSAEDFKAAKEMIDDSDSASEELSEDELEAIAGGGDGVLTKAVKAAGKAWDNFGHWWF
ncbi:MAG: hypothetical protein Tsb0014_22320 [Pleurocapsa sp.]